MRLRQPIQCSALGLLLAFAIFTGRSVAQTLSPAFDTLTNAAQVRSLNADVVAQARPVLLRGVVISDEASPRERAVIIADQTAGIYVLAAKNIFASCHRGDLLEITGVTDPGEFAPIVRAHSIRKLGRSAIPPPRHVTYQELISGAMDAQWVEISGVVRRRLDPAAPGFDIWRLVIAMDGGSVSVRVPIPVDPLVRVDAEVRLSGICLYQFNQKRQVLTPVVQVARGGPIRVEKDAPAEPYDLPVRPANSLLLFTPDSAVGHRIHVHGIVTYSQSDSFIWIRDQSSGLRLQTYQHPINLHPGDEIDALGFPSYGSMSPVLEDASFRKTGSGPPPVPHSFTNFNEAFDHEDDLVATDALLTDIQPTVDGAAFTLSLTGAVFKAILKFLPEQRILPAWQAGSKVRIAGICSVGHDSLRPIMGIWHPQTFQLQLRSPEDLIVIEPPPWWTSRHIILLLGIALSGLLLASSIVTLLARRRLNEQSRQRAMAEAEFAAILAERNRMAREIHDTLAQGLVATSVQLRLAKKQATGAPDPLNQYLDTAQQLVRGSLEEARNSIWNMRSQVLETGDLSGALKNILKQMAEGTELKTSFETTGRVRRLAPVVENNCLRVGQAAITNATKHAQAKEIKVRLDYDEKFLRLIVTDDGRGFDPAQLSRSEGGFGLVGMRERATGMKATLDIRSAAGQGAEIQLCVPLSGD